MGHEGRTRPIPDKINSIEIIPPPDVCPRCGQTDIEQTQAFTSKYIEDLVPLTRHVTQRRYLEGICSHCRTAGRTPWTTQSHRGRPAAGS